jgi:hypothetical protein
MPPRPAPSANHGVPLTFVSVSADDKSLYVACNHGNTLPI